jgi:PAS domain S-box-containing protein
MADESTPMADADVGRLLEAVAAQAPTLGIRTEVIDHLREQRQQLAEMIRREEAARAEADAARADAVATRQKADEAVRALAESEQRYRYMGETIPFGVWWCNPKGEAEYVSPSFCELLDMTLEEQQKFGWTKRLVPEDVEPMMTKWLHCCETGTPWDHEHRIIDRHGKIHTVLSRGLPVRNDTGQIIAFVGVNLDITDRKHIELQLQEAKEALEQALTAKDRFVANISHELRTPLTLILGPVE